MKAILDIGVVSVTVLIMGAVGMELEGRHLRDVARGKGTLVLILLAQAVVLPVLGLGLTRAMALPQHISAGILLLAACPVGDIANVYTLLARANVALASAIAITLLNRIENAVFAVVYFLAEVPLLLGVVAGYRAWWAPAVPQAGTGRQHPVK